MDARYVNPHEDASRGKYSTAHRAHAGVARLVLVATVALAWILMLLGALQGDGAGVPARTAGAAPPRAARFVLPQVGVTIAPGVSMVSVRHSFLGISTEYWALPVFERNVALFERVLSLVHVQDGAPLVLRIGGDSADRAFWGRRALTTPRWAFVLSPGWLRRTSMLVRGAGVRLMLDLNLITGSSLMAAEWARAAEGSLPRGSIVGFEIGNEPDIYSRRYWLASISRTRLSAGFLPSGLSANSYTQAFQSYAQALAQVAPLVPLVGPAVAHLGLSANWISSLISGANDELGMVSAHRYPYSACAARSARNFPTIARLLSEQASAGMAQTVRTGARLAHRARLPFRLTELNSVTCGGRPGVSDTFATALWAPDALFELLRAGADGVNVHVRADAINAAFALTRYGLRARPLLYGLILFARTLGPNARLVQLQLHERRAWHLKAWAVRVHGGVLHVLLIDKAKQSVSVGLQLPATGSATVERLLAPSGSSRSGITLGGQHLARDGSWQDQRATQTITPDAHGYRLTIPRLSAALLTVHLRPGALALNHRHGTRPTHMLAGGRTPRARERGPRRLHGHRRRA